MKQVHLTTYGWRMVSVLRDFYNMVGRVSKSRVGRCCLVASLYTIAGGAGGDICDDE